MKGRRQIVAGLVAASLLVWGASVAGAQGLTEPGGTDAAHAPPLAPACAHVVNLYPPSHAGYGVVTVDFISDGSLTNGATTVTGINASLCSVFQAPQDPVLALPPSLFSNPAGNAPFNPAVPQTAAVFSAGEITYSTANVQIGGLGPLLAVLGVSGAGQLTLTPVPLPSSVPCVSELAAAGQPAPALCSTIEQQPPPGGGFNLDIVTEAVNRIYLPSVANPVVVCTLAPATIPLTTNGKFLSGSSAAKPIKGPLTHALATVVSTPQFALPPASCTLGGAPNPIVTQVINVALKSGTPQFTAPLLLQLSLTQAATG